MGIERASVHLLESGCEASHVLRRGIGREVEVHGGAPMAVDLDRHPPDHHVVDTVAGEGFEEKAEIEGMLRVLTGFAHAAPVSSPDGHPPRFLSGERKLGGDPIPRSRLAQSLARGQLRQRRSAGPRARSCRAARTSRASRSPIASKICASRSTRRRLHPPLDPADRVLAGTGPHRQPPLTQPMLRPRFTQDSCRINSDTPYGVSLLEEAALSCACWNASSAGGTGGGGPRTEAKPPPAGPPPPVTGPAAGAPGSLARLARAQRELLGDLVDQVLRPSGLLVDRLADALLGLVAVALQRGLDRALALAGLALDAVPGPLRLRRRLAAGGGATAFGALQGAARTECGRP